MRILTVRLYTPPPPRSQLLSFSLIISGAYKTTRIDQGEVEKTKGNLQTSRSFPRN